MTQMKAYAYMGKVTRVNNRPVCPLCSHITKWYSSTSLDHPVEVEPMFLVKRVNRHTNDWFWGCPNFPRCRHTENRPPTREELDIKTWAWANATNPPNC